MKISFKLVVSTIVFLFIVSNLSAEAQFLKKLKKKIERKVENEVDKKIDKEINKTGNGEKKVEEKAEESQKSTDKNVVKTVKKEVPVEAVEEKPKYSTESKKESNSDSNSKRDINQTKSIFQPITKEEVDRYQRIFDKLKQNSIPLFAIDEVPVFLECESVSKQNMRNCFNKQLLKHNRENFYLPEGIKAGGNSRRRIQGSFIINLFGKVVGIKVHVNNLYISDIDNLKLQYMGVDLISKLPEFKPGINRGKKVNVSVPFLLNVMM